MSVMRRQAGIAVLITASLALALLAGGYHAHGLPVAHAHDHVADACADESAISAVCTVCTLVHVSPVGVGCVETHTPRLEQRLGPHDTVTLPDAPALRSHGSRAPPAPHVFGV